MAQCIEKTKEGKQCNMPRLKRDAYCFIHSEKTRGAREKLRSEMGKREKHQALDPVTLETQEDLRKMIAECTNLVRAKKIDKTTSSEIRGFANIMLESIKASRLEKRVEKLEAIAKHIPITEIYNED